MLLKKFLNSKLANTPEPAKSPIIFHENISPRDLYKMNLNETAVLVFAICSLYSRFRLPCHYFLTSKR